jgi:hypothetical protein
MGLFSKFFGERRPSPPCAIHPDDRDLVSPEDIEWWNNLSFQDYQALEQEDNVFLLSAYKKFRESDGLSAEEAGENVRLKFLFYYLNLEQRADEKFTLEAADARLPYVLKNRINRAVMRRLIDKSAIMQASSMNALVRDYIRSRRI